MIKLATGALLLFVLLLPVGCSPSASTPENATIVRVRLLENQEKVMLAASGAPQFKTARQSQPTRIDFPQGAAVPVTLAPDGWRIGGATLEGGELTIYSAYIGSMSVNGQAYRGAYRFVPVSAGRFDVVNDIDVDSYLGGVLAKELPGDWDRETYRAQAIVARTYALYEARANGASRHFDVDDDERSQVYGGMSAETDKSRDAALYTSGVVVASGPPGKERIFKAYFSSCCGGEGQTPHDAFGEPDLPPLVAKTVGNLCSASPKFNWGPLVLSKAELTRRIRIWGARHSPPRPERNMAMLTKIEVAPGGMQQNRPLRFFITDARGQQYAMTGEELRWSCNADYKNDPGKGPILPSSFFKPVMTADSIQFVDGHGWGHGVGMCQWCAQAMALQGRRHEDIVRLSFPNSVLVRAY